MNGHSKFIGYLTIGVLLAGFVAWAKYGLLSDSALWAIAIASGCFFAGWRIMTGTWPGNDAPR